MPSASAPTAVGAMANTPGSKPVHAASGPWAAHDGMTVMPPLPAGHGDESPSLHDRVGLVGVAVRVRVAQLDRRLDARHPDRHRRREARHGARPDARLRHTGEQSAERERRHDAKCANSDCNAPPAHRLLPCFRHGLPAREAIVKTRALQERRHGFQRRPEDPNPADPRSVLVSALTTRYPGRREGHEQQLRDPVAGLDREALAALVAEDDLDLAAVARVDQPRRVDERDAVLRGQPGAGGDQAGDPVRQGDRDPGRHDPVLARRDDLRRDRAQVVARVALAGARRGHGVGVQQLDLERAGRHGGGP